MLTTRLRVSSRQFGGANLARYAHTKVKAGQPIYETRPHRIADGDLTPGISALEYYARRQRILESIPDRSAVLVAGNTTQFATASVFHPFIQDPNFYYLTGFLEANSAVLLHRESSSNMKSVFFVPGSNPAVELWDGERTGTKGAIEIFNADEAYSIDQIQPVLSKLLSSSTTAYVDTAAQPRYPAFFNQSLTTTLQHSPVSKIHSAQALVEQFRLVKTEPEIDAMRQASEISAAAYNRAYATKFTSESDLHAFLDYNFRIGGCEAPAYLAVVAGGPHALTIHYTRNDDVLRDGELVLVDAGGKYGGYCADISRTWPVNGRFSEPQRDLYQAVLNAQKQCIELCTTDQGYSLADIHRKSEEFLYTELRNAGMATLTPSNLRQLYPHYIGHNLGIDVHDIKTASSVTPLVSNQVITIEPGVYVPQTDAWPKHFQGIGIRIEDNVVIGKSAYEVLTADAAKEIAEIEELATSRA